MKTNDDISHDFKVSKMTRWASGGGTWVIGKISGHLFNALVFPEHALMAEYEMGDSRISKLWIRREADQETVCNFDRGWDIRPTTKTAQAIADFLAAGLAEHTYGK